MEALHRAWGLDRSPERLLDPCFLLGKDGGGGGCQGLWTPVSCRALWCLETVRLWHDSSLNKVRAGMEDTLSGHKLQILLQATAETCHWGYWDSSRALPQWLPAGSAEETLQ